MAIGSGRQHRLVTERGVTRIASQHDVLPNWLRVLTLLLLLIPSWQSLPAMAAPAAQVPQDQEITAPGGAVIGHYYRQTGGGSGLGYSVLQPFFTAMTAFGGVNAVGYPVSIPFRVNDGCTYQDFQITLLQTCASDLVQRANTFQILQDAGVDGMLQERGIGPGESDGSSSFAEAVRVRLSWLDDRAIAEKYLQQCGGGDQDAAIQACGLPMNHPRSAGPFVVQRFQRIAFQRWLTDGPGGIKAGDVSSILGGDLLKETNVLTGVVVQPHALGQVPAAPLISFAPAAPTATPVPGGRPPAAVNFRDRATLSILQTTVDYAASTAPAAFRPGNEGQDIGVGDNVRTGPNGDALVTYFEGTTVELTSGAIYRLDRLQQTASGGSQLRATQLAGVVIHRVVALATADSEYQLETPAATMVVRGSTIRTSIIATGPVAILRVEIFKGLGDVTAQGQTVQVQPGFLTEVQLGQPPQQPVPNTNPAPSDTPPTAGGASPTPSPTPSRTPTPPPAARSAPLSYGMQADLFDTARRPAAISLIKNANFGWAKQQIVWAQYEISQAQCNANRGNCLEEMVNGKAKYFKKDWIGFLDAVITDVNAAGLKLMVSVVSAPDHYAAPGGHAPSDPVMLGDFVHFLINRYKGKINAMEPWNEQNLSWEWGGARLWPNAPAAPPQGILDFIRLQKAAWEGVKTASGEVIVVLPALTPTGVGECWLNPEARMQGFCLDAVKLAIDDRLYLDLLFQVNGAEIKNYYDVLGVHPSGYNNPPDDFVGVKTVPDGRGFKGHGSFYIKRYQQLREVQLKYGDNKPMWFTEVGWSVTPNAVPGYEYALDNTEAARGKYFARMLEQVQQEAPYVTNLFIWNLNFRMLHPQSDEKYGFGIVNADGGPTPAYNCVADFVKNGNKITRADCR